MKEEGTDFGVYKGVFYNPAMTFCRSISSLAVGAVGEKVVVCDSFCASGIRGIRYSRENRNVKKVVFVDIEKKAVRNTKKNAEKNKIRHEAVCGNFSRLVFDIVADFLEVDPFGTPAPYLYDAMRVFNPLKKAYLSITATDVAVLCGAKTRACMKNYHSKPMNNEFTHETGMRILLKKIAETAAEFNMGIEPVVSLSDRHYLKTVLKLSRGADLAHSSMTSLGYVNFCPRCGFRNESIFPAEKCPSCRKKTDYAGPLWLGKLHDRKFLGKMKALGSGRKYGQKKEIETKLKRMEGEAGMPPYYYNIHKLCRIWNVREVPPIESVINRILNRGHRAVRTHFSNNGIKTDAPLKIIKKAVFPQHLK